MMPRLSLCLTAVILLIAAGQTQGQDTSTQAVNNDLNALNYALTLENLEAAFYTQGQAKFANSDFLTAGYAQGVYDYFTVIKGHEVAHVSALSQTISAGGGTPVAACTYNFVTALANVTQYVKTALALESTGVSAYDGAINGITNTAYQQVAATIATIEARHASYLRYVNGQTSAPNTLDTASSPSTVVGIAGQFITSCPYTISTILPVIRPGGVATPNSYSNYTPSSTQPDSAAKYSQAQFNNDIVALNYALTLENFEAAFYNYGQNKFNQNSFTSVYGTTNGTLYYNQLVLIQAHENAHVNALTTTINGRVANAAVPACTYTFTSITTVQQYLATAAVLERTGVSAYDGAVNTIVDTGLQQVAATIATVEAEHAAFLNIANQNAPVDATSGSSKNGNFDTATSPADTLTAVMGTGLLTSCPYTIQTPSVVYYSSAADRQYSGIHYTVATVLVAMGALFYA